MVKILLVNNTIKYQTTVVFIYRLGCRLVITKNERLSFIADNNYLSL
jgi:hypothetical protein